jgi:hypothetical protein
MNNGIAAIPHAAGADRVRANTHPDVNARLDRQAQDRIESAASGREDEHLDRLAREWDFERIVEAEAALTGLAGLALAVTVDRRFLFIPGVATAMMLVHALQGWYPLLPLLRRMGVRSQDEIERERYAIKALRGDFAPVASETSIRRADAAWRAVLA